MEFTTETVATREVEFTIRPDVDQVENARREAARKLAKRLRIPGFRPGKAPFALVERTVGKEALTEEAADILAPDLYKKALDEGHFEPFAQPSLRISQTDPLEMKIRVALEPVVELADYHAMHVEPEAVPQVTDQQVDDSMTTLREQHGTWEPVTRAAQMGDQVTLDVKGEAEGEQIFDETGSQMALTETMTPQGFAAAIVGMEPGQSREFEIKYPADAPQQKAAGKTVKFNVTLNEVKERKLPPLDDEFAHSVGDYATIDDLRGKLRAALQERQDAEARQKLADKILGDVVAQSKFELPNAAVEQQIDGTVQARESRLKQQGFTMESYLSAVHKSMQQLRDEIRPEAEETVKRSLVLSQVGKAEKIEVKPDEVAGQLERIASAYGEQAPAVRQALMQQGALASVYGDLYTEKALARLVDVVTGKAEQAQPEAEKPAEEQPAASEAGKEGSGETPATE